jgi:hypothetical protein
LPTSDHVGFWIGIDGHYAIGSGLKRSAISAKVVHLRPGKSTTRRLQHFSGTPRLPIRPNRSKTSGDNPGNAISRDPEAPYSPQKTDRQKPNIDKGERISLWVPSRDSTTFGLQLAARIISPQPKYSRHCQWRTQRCNCSLFQISQRVGRGPFDSERWGLLAPTRQRRFPTRPLLPKTHGE